MNKREAFSQGLTKRGFDPKRIIEATTVLMIVGSLLTLFNFRLMTPADALENHVEDFDLHITSFEHYVEDDQVQRALQAQTSVMLTTQTRLMCLQTGRDTLAMLGVVQTCDSLGVPR